MKTWFYRSLLSFILLALGFSLNLGWSSEPTSKPNFLLIVGDDCTYNDLPVYGGQNAKTPHIDALAAEGLVFDQAFLSSAMCQPCRAELYTGLYPMRNGCAWNHSACRPEVKSLPHHLRPLGYRVGLAGKGHVKPASVFPFDQVAGFDPNCVRDPTETADLAGIRDYIERSDDPFCLTVALVEPHVPWVMGDASAYPVKKLKLPPNIADTPATRQHFADYLAEITYMDAQIGEILACLDATGKADNTLVIFTSEQGSQFPGCKWTNWNTGLHTGFIARWPKHTPQARTPALIQYADVTPTLLDLAGAEADTLANFDGSSFAQVLLGQSDQHRKYTYGMHNNVPEGPPYPIRSIYDGQHHYIRNLLPEELYIEKHLMGGGRLKNPYYATWLGAGPYKPDVYQLVHRYMRRPAEQLYHTAQDPYEMNNLTGQDQWQATQATLSAELDKWIAEQKDPGAKLDTVEVHRAAKQVQHEF